MSKNQFTGTAMHPQRNCKICQFNNDQYCILLSVTIASAKPIQGDFHAHILDSNAFISLNSTLLVYLKELRTLKIDLYVNVGI